MADDRLVQQLRSMASALDERALPVTADEAARGSSLSRRAIQRLALAGIAAGMVLVVGILAWTALDGDDEARVVTPSPAPTSTVPNETAATVAGEGFDWNALPQEGIAIQPLDGPLQLFSLAGDRLGSAPGLVDVVNGPRLSVYPGQVDAELVSAAEVPEGCTSADDGGGVRVALCGRADDLPDRIDVVDSAGQATVLRDGLPQVGTSEPALGHWRWAAPSPDGRWVLAQWSGECEAPMAFLIEVATGEYRTVSGESGADWFDGPASFGLGWAPDGRPVVALAESACGTSAPEPGVYLLDPASGQLDLVVPSTAAAEQSFLWTLGIPGNALEALTSQALTELGLEGCCGEPSHGGAGVASGAVFEGYDIGIHGAPTGSAADLAPTGSTQRMSLLHGQAAITSGTAGGPYGSTVVAFTCGANTWRLSWWDEGTPEVDSMLLLAEALVPHLACTLGAPPDA